MAIGPPGMFYDANRDMYVGSDFFRQKEMAEREHYRQKEEEYRRQQMLMQDPRYNPRPTVQQEQVKQPDALSFLHNTDNKLLLTGEIK